MEMAVGKLCSRINETAAKLAHAGVRLGVCSRQ